MPRLPRNMIIDQDVPGVYHCIQRCVRRAFLCGDDAVSGRSYEHRRAWIRERLEELAGCFAIDVLTYAVMHNHLHVVVRNRPDVVKEWNDKEVVERWWKIFPQVRNRNGEPAPIADDQLAAMLADKKRILELRRRLSDISWLMRCLSETIARRANQEDEVTGRFWEGRFKTQQLLDEAAILACAAYVDLNPIRAAIAKTPEQSKFTGIADRIADKKSGGRRKRSGWMSPIETKRADPVGPDRSKGNRRASNKGFCAISEERYLQLVDWTGRQFVKGKRGKIPSHLEPILTRLGLPTDNWCALVAKFGKYFKRTAGNPNSLSQAAAESDKAWLQAPGRNLFAAT